ncbi:MAG: fumarylacetoacetate hydrolase family protein [Nitrospinota bacterium]
MARYALTSYERGNQFRVGVVVGAKGFDCMDACEEVLGSPLFEGEYPMHELLAGLHSVHPQLEELADALADYDRHLVPESALRAPILYPPAIFCAAANYKAHAQEMGGEVTDKSKGQPYFFLKIPHVCVIGPGETVRLPKNSRRVDWEAELAVVIGVGGTEIPVERALDHVAGYTIINDVSARDRNVRPEWKFKWDWFGGKNAPTFAPMGPHIIPKAYIRDPNDLYLKLWINDDLMQDANTKDMIFDVRDQISYLSTLVPLSPGDVIATGTPEGVGMGRGVFLKEGDKVTIEIEGIGRLINPVGKQRYPLQGG